MKEELYQLAKEYVGVIEKIEKTKDPKKIRFLDEKRSELHWKFIDMLNEQHMEFKDRDDVARIAYKIVRGEL